VLPSANPATTSILGRFTSAAEAGCTPTAAWVVAGKARAARVEVRASRREEEEEGERSVVESLVSCDAEAEVTRQWRRVRIVVRIGIRIVCEEERLRLLERRAGAAAAAAAEREEAARADMIRLVWLCGGECDEFFTRLLRALMTRGFYFIF
jgi:hypothetical protein